MYLYFDNKGNLKEQINDEALRQGNSNINKLYVFWEKSVDNENITALWSRFRSSDNTYYPSSSTWNITTTYVEEMIPYDKGRDLKYFKYFKTYKFYTIMLPDIVLGVSGSWLGTLSFVEVNGNVHSLTTMGEIAFYVSESNASVRADENINIAQWNQLISLISDIEEDYVSESYLESYAQPLDSKLTSFSELSSSESGFLKLTNGVASLESIDYGNNYSIAYNLVVNRNGYQFSGYKFASVTISGYDYTIKQLQVSSTSEVVLDLDVIQNYLECITGHRRVPVYDLDKPSDEFVVLSSDNSIWKLQYDSSNGLLAFKVENLPLYTDGVKFLTSAPTQANTSGVLKFVLLDEEPENKYDGYCYIIY